MSSKVAVVTGSNKGIGLGIVRALLKDPSFKGIVYLTARDKGRGEEAPSPPAVMAGRSRPKDGVASACLCPAIHVFLALWS